MENLLTLRSGAAERLIGAADGDAALLYILVQFQGGTYDRKDASVRLRMDEARLHRAEELLRALDLLAPETDVPLLREERSYSDEDIKGFLGRDNGFRMLVDEAQRRMGKTLSTESIRTLLSIYDWLGLPMEVISMVIGYCMDRARDRGSSNPPTMRIIEKESAEWVKKEIDTVEKAAAYVRTQQEVRTRSGQYRRALGITGKLSQKEERYLADWAGMCFDAAVVEQAYEITRINTGAFKWPYMNSVLCSWHEKGLHTAEQLQKAKAQERKEDRRTPTADDPMNYEQMAVSRLRGDTTDNKG